jgi:hypothetical protein
MDTERQGIITNIVIIVIEVMHMMKVNGDDENSPGTLIPGFLVPL